MYNHCLKAATKFKPVRYLHSYQLIRSWNIIGLRVQAVVCCGGLETSRSSGLLNVVISTEYRVLLSKPPIISRPTIRSPEMKRVDRFIINETSSV